jgi:hypothetical protein
MESLREGQAIEVLWLITNRRGSMRRVWWDATVTTLIEGSRETGLKGELLYARGHGYAPQSTSVTFRDGSILLERGTGAKEKPHKWRLAGT